MLRVNKKTRAAGLLGRILGLRHLADDEIRASHCQFPVSLDECRVRIRVATSCALDERCIFQELNLSRVNYPNGIQHRRPFGSLLVLARYLRSRRVSSAKAIRIWPGTN
jgi:hypothetical protein